ncbi:MAG: hypothetical protein EOP83_01610 [Verrucomicrobiaceae bacterium]|nr:MAG: hypothetical protein EOP83_01610 [Verrucomicrobiaceae bacterium]
MWTIAKLLDPAENPEAKYLQGHRTQLIADFIARSGLTEPSVARKHAEEKADRVMQWLCDGKNEPILERSIYVFFRCRLDVPDNKNYFVRLIGADGETVSETYFYSWNHGLIEYRRMKAIHG